jgi:hypothetical protein
MELPRLNLGIRVNPDDPTDPDADLPVFIDGKSRYTGLLMVGKSGTGKSEMLKTFYAQDSLYPISRVLVDPSGSTAPDCFSISRGKNTRYISLENPGSLNMMAMPYRPAVRAAIVADVINQCIKQGTKDSVNNLSPKMRNILSAAVHWCIEHDQLNLFALRDHIASEKSDRETRDGIIQRLSYVLDDDRMAAILCGPNPIEWGEMISKGQSLILDCFGMGHEHRIFAGNIVSQGIMAYFVYERPAEYRPVSLYFDEFHSFFNTAFFTVLREARKYRVGTIMATTDLAAFDDRMVRVLMNVGNIISFKVSSREAQQLARELRVEAGTLQTMEKFHLAFMTPNVRGIARAPRPVPIIKRFQPAPSPLTTHEPMPTYKPTHNPPTPAVPTETITATWFPLEPYQPHETTNSEAVPADAHGAETMLSRTMDG